VHCGSTAVHHASLHKALHLSNSADSSCDVRRQFESPPRGLTKASRPAGARSRNGSQVEAYGGVQWMEGGAFDCDCSFLGGGASASQKGVSCDSSSAAVVLTNKEWLALSKAEQIEHFCSGNEFAEQENPCRALVVR
jgi:hypothetical protein